MSRYTAEVLKLYAEHPEMIEEDLQYDREKSNKFWEKLGIPSPRIEVTGSIQTSRLHAAGLKDIAEELRPKFEEFVRMRRESWAAAQHRVLD